MQSIESQKTILDALPNDYNQAMRVICQLLANMMLSGHESWDINRITAEIELHLAEYAGT